MSHGIPNLVDEMLRYPDELRRAYAILVASEQPASLTPRQSDLLAFIREHREEHGVVPTYRQMASAMRTSLSAVNWMVAELAERGAITRKPRARQSIVIVERA